MKTRLLTGVYFLLLLLVVMKARVYPEVYVPESRYNNSQYGNVMTNIHQPPGFVSFVTQLQADDYFIIHADGWASNTSWSFGTSVNDVNRTWNISRNDQGSWPSETNWAQLVAPVPASLNYTVFISMTNPSAATEKFGILQTGAYPVYIASVTCDLVAVPDSNFTVDITTSGTPDVAERILVRYTTNDWTGSLCVEASGSGTAYTALIPPVRSGSLLKFYALTTAASDLYITNGDHDYVTLSCFSNQPSPYIYYVSGTLHTVEVDGTNDFNTNSAERFETSTSGYTNWITWDSNYLYLGFFGSDIGAGDANKMLYVYFSTNTNRQTNAGLTTGSAYGEGQGGQLPVLPFCANYFVRFLTTGSVDSGVWTNDAWDTGVSPLASGISNVRDGNYLEMRIHRTNFMNSAVLGSPDLNVVSFMLNKTSGSENIYSAMPKNALVDGFNQAPGSYLDYRNSMWISNRKPSDAGYEAQDNVPPYTNSLLWPVDNQSFNIGTTITLSNFSRDETGIYFVEIYTNLNALYGSFWVTNTNALYTHDIVATNFGEGVYNFYTKAYDTANAVFSRTNTNIVFQITADLTVCKSVSSYQLPGINKLQPGALITYKITYTNNGPHAATNVVIYDKVPEHTSFYTNYAGSASGWAVQYSHIANPDQSYGSSDYDTADSNVIWIRWTKQSVLTNEVGKDMFFGVTLD